MEEPCRVSLSSFTFISIIRCKGFVCLLSCIQSTPEWIDIRSISGLKSGLGFGFFFQIAIGTNVDICGSQLSKIGRARSLHSTGCLAHCGSNLRKDFACETDADKLLQSVNQVFQSGQSGSDLQRRRLISIHHALVLLIHPVTHSAADFAAF